MKIGITTLLLSVFLSLVSCTETVKYVDNSPEEDYGQTVNGKDVSWFRDAKFGIIIHWGPVSQRELEISWSRRCASNYSINDQDSCELFASPTLPQSEYDSLYKTFNPINFNPDEWMSIFKEAGAKYLVFVTKHHDGFSMYDTKYSNYKITTANSPYRVDILKKVVDATRKAGLRVGLYYSRPDWYHPDAGTARHSNFVKYVHNQLVELCSNYGMIDLFFFDSSLDEYYVDSYNLYNKIMGLQPKALINDRLGYGEDFVSPEGTLHRFERERLWETVNPIGRGWSWRGNDPYENSTYVLIHNIVKVVSQDGNYLLGIGPKPDGTISQDHADKLKAVGEWIKRYGECIYGTRGGPYKPVDSRIYTTCKSKNFYINVLEWKNTDVITLNKFPANIKNVSLLGSGTRLEYSNLTDGLKIWCPKEQQNGLVTIIKVETDTTTFKVRPI